MKRLAVSCFGLGRLPIAPGTWGSLPPAIIFAVMCYLGLSVLLTSIVMAILVLVGSIVCVKFAPLVIAETGQKDPGQVVVDEVAGQALTFLAAGVVSAGQSWVAVLAGFLLFRLFDITKPWPIRKLEKLPAGWGILCDDLLAGVYAGITLLVCLSLPAAGIVDLG